MGIPAYWLGGRDIGELPLKAKCEEGDYLSSPYTPSQRNAGKVKRKKEQKDEEAKTRRGKKNIRRQKRRVGEDRERQKEDVENLIPAKRDEDGRVKKWRKKITSRTENFIEIATAQPTIRIPTIQQERPTTGVGMIRGSNSSYSENEDGI